jgi:formamidopyrimidine-DNA glycosylase
MPELPEVETARRRMEKAFKGKRITEIKGDSADRYLFKNAPVPAVEKALQGAKVVGSGRKGKYFWLELDRKPWPIFHLGMSGNIEVKGKKGAHEKAWGGRRFWSARGHDNAPMGTPFFTRLLLTADNGNQVALTDPRRFGRMWLSEDPLAHPSIKKLGFDPLFDFPTAKELGAILAKRKAPIKAVLLDQGVFAGIGNWIADEVLFHAKLDPRRKASELKPAEVNRLRTKILTVIQKAVEVEADYERFPASWLFHVRWGKQKNAQTHAKQKIIHEEIGGRTTAWVPSVQK